MSYNTLATAKAIVGVDLTQELLDEAQSIIHNYTDYRWEATTVTDTYSSKDYRAFYGQGRLIKSLPSDDASVLLPRSELSIFLKMPVTTLTSVTIDDVTQTADTDYEIRMDIGELRIIAFAFIGSSSLTGVGDISIVYTYGYDSSHDAFPLVQGAEARIALLMKHNPLLLPSISLQGDAVNYGSDHIETLLKRIPKPFGVKVIPK